MGLQFQWYKIWNEKAKAKAKDGQESEERTDNKPHKTEKIEDKIRTFCTAAISGLIISYHTWPASQLPHCFNFLSSTWIAMAVLAALIFTSIVLVLRVESSWCVARSDASDQALQAALDYACGFGADCAPILSDGLCYLPNTLLAHASYAYNSYYQRKGRAPGSCDFAGTANIARTDPSTLV